MYSQFMMHGQKNMKLCNTFRSFLLSMRNSSDKKRCTGNQNTHFVFSNLFSNIVPFMR